MNLLDLIYGLMFHLDDYLAGFIMEYGLLVYILIFAVIFSETGLFVLFLPGDSFIFACATFAAVGLIDIWALILICFFAAFFGEILNFYFGRTWGRKLYTKAERRFIKKENIEKAGDFYEKYGGKAIILSRFVPILRQFTPFVVGIGGMSYRKFMVYNLIAVVLWIGLISAAGYFFGNIPIVQNNFSIVLILIVLISLLPAVIAYFKAKREI